MGGCGGRLRVRTVPGHSTLPKDPPFLVKLRAPCLFVCMLKCALSGKVLFIFTFLRSQFHPPPPPSFVFLSVGACLLVFVANLLCSI